MAYAKPNTVDEYIAAQDVAFREPLEALRALIRSEAPDAEELIAYQVPCFKDRYMLVSFGVTKNACSLYTMSPALVKQMKTELQGQKLSGATLHFAPSAPLPEELIRRIVRARRQENAERAAAKKKG